MIQRKGGSRDECRQPGDARGSLAFGAARRVAFGPLGGGRLLKTEQLNKEEKQEDLLFSVN